MLSSSQGWTEGTRNALSFQTLEDGGLKRESLFSLMIDEIVRSHAYLFEVQRASSVPRYFLSICLSFSPQGWTRSVCPFRALYVHVQERFTSKPTTWSKRSR